MRKVFTILAATMFAGAAFAETENVAIPTPVLSGEVSLDFAETANDKWGGTMGLELGVDLGGTTAVDLNFEAVDGGALTLDTWAVGTVVGGVGLAFGDDLSVMPEAFDEDHATLAAPAMAEAAQVMVGDAKVAIGFNDWTADVTDISNIQGAYTLNLAPMSITAAGDYNLDSENIVVGAGVGGIDLAGYAELGGTVTYDVDGEKFAFEGVANVMGVTAYANGDQDDAFQNVGGEYSYSLGGAAVTAGANYNVDTEDFAPTAGIAFKF